MKAKFTLLLAAGLFFAAASQAQTRHDLYNIDNDKREMAIGRRNIIHDDFRDRRDLRRDRRELRYDRRNLRFDRRKAGADKFRRPY